MDLFTIPRHWKRLVVTIWNPMIGKAMFIIRKPFAAMSCSTGSGVKMLTVGPGNTSDTTNPTMHTRVAQRAVFT